MSLLLGENVVWVCQHVLGIYFCLDKLQFEVWFLTNHPINVKLFTVLIRFWLLRICADYLYKYSASGHCFCMLYTACLRKKRDNLIFSVLLIRVSWVVSKPSFLLTLCYEPCSYFYNFSQGITGLLHVRLSLTHPRLQKLQVLFSESLVQLCPTRRPRFSVA